MARKRYTKTKFRLAANLLFLAAIAVLTIGIVASLNQHNTHTSGQPASIQNDNDPAPNTVKPSQDDFETHQVPPDQPRYISIPKISVIAIVKSVGVNSENQILSPANVYETGWYNGSAKPGLDGAMLISGHVSSWETDGVFYDLNQLESGDKITIERGDSTKFTYEVSKRETYNADNVDMEAALSPINPKKPGLNLITCAGDVIEGTNEFDKRIVVFAEQVN